MTPSGLGIGGGPRYGRPKTDAERRAAHRKLYGSRKLPPRGTGIKKGKTLLTQ